MVVMAPFRDELSHGQWFRERLPPPSPSFHRERERERVKSSLRLAEDRAQWNCRGARCRLSPPVSRVDPEICNGLSYSYTSFHQPRIPWLSPSTVSPLTRLLHTNPRFAFLSIFSTIFPPLHCSPRFIRNQIVAKPWLWEGCTGSPLTDTYNGTRGGKSGAAEDDVRVKWLRYRILADAICAIIPSVFNERRWIVWSCYFEICWIVRPFVLLAPNIHGFRDFSVVKLLLFENKHGSWEFFWGFFLFFFCFSPPFLYFRDNNISDVSRTRIKEISKWNFRLIFREIFSNEIPGAEIRVMGRSNSRNLFFFSGAPRRRARLGGTVGFIA